MADHALRTTFTAYTDWRPGEFGLGAIRAPLDAAQLYATVGVLVGDNVMIAAHDGYATACCSTDRLSDGHTSVPAVLRKELLRAFSVARPHHEWGLRTRLLDSAAPSSSKNSLRPRLSKRLNGPLSHSCSSRRPTGASDRGS
jgi:hypothetical protein